MNLPAMTFAELHEACSPANLAKLMEQRDTALRLAWARACLEDELFVPSIAAREFPEVASEYNNKLLALSSPYAFSLLRDKADEIRDIPSQQSPFLLREIFTRNSPFAWHLGDVIVAHCKACRVTAFVRVADCAGFNESVQVWALTTEAGAAILWHKRGLSWEALKSECAKQAVKPEDVFWWAVLAGTPERLNPILSPVNTPDVLVNVKKLLS